MAELNNIYVALTRSRDELYVFLPQKVGNSFNLVNSLIPENIRETGARVKPRAKPRRKPSVMELPPRNTMTGSIISKTNFSLRPEAPAGREPWAGGTLTARSGCAGRSSILCSHLSAIGTAPILRKAWRAQEQAQSRFPYLKGSRQIISPSWRNYSNPREQNRSFIARRRKS